MFRWQILCTLFALLLGPAWSSAWACPMCKMAVEADNPQPRAFMISILFMLAVILTIFGGMTALIYWVNRLEKKSLIDAGYEHILDNAVSPAIAPRPE